MSQAEIGQRVEPDDERQAAVRLVVDTVARLARLAEHGAGAEGIDAEMEAFKSLHGGTEVAYRAGGDKIGLTALLRRILLREARAYWHRAAELDGEGAHDAALQRRRVSVLLEGGADALVRKPRSRIPSRTVLPLRPPQPRARQSDIETKQHNLTKPDIS